MNLIWFDFSYTYGLVQFGFGDKTNGAGQGELTSNYQTVWLEYGLVFMPLTSLVPISPGKRKF